MNQRTSVHSRTNAMIEAAVMIALATVLSLIRIIDLPYGGSVTIASMLPILLIAYRRGIGWGLLSGLVFGVIQQLLGLKNLSYVTGWQSVVAVILLDYLVAFAVIGFGGAFRKPIRHQATALTVGAILACLLRYVCHVISGATVWAGLSIPTNAALLYSLAYNATYMVPETIVLAVAAFEIGTLIDFRPEQLTRLKKQEGDSFSLPRMLGGLLLSAAAIFDVASIFSHLQDAESGEWNFAGISQVNWIPVVIVSAVAIAASAVLFIVAGQKNKKN